MGFLKLKFSSFEWNILQVINSIRGYDKCNLIQPLLKEKHLREKKNV